MKRVITHKGQLRINRYEWREEHYANGGKRGWRQKVGDDLVEVTMAIDADDLLDRLGAKAWKNKSKRAKAQWGMIDVKAVKV